MSPSHADSKRSSTLRVCSAGFPVPALRSIDTRFCAKSQQGIQRGSKKPMRVSVEALGSSREPHLRVYPEQMLAMLLQPGSIEMGWRRSELTRFAYDAGEIILARRHVETWVRTAGLHYLSVAISDTALRAVRDGMASEVELRSSPKLQDARVGALVAAVNAERIAGFPSGRLFLDSVEQALAVALVTGHAVRHGSVCLYRGGLGPARLRRVTELVHTEIDHELSLDKMAETAGLSTAHF